MNTTPAGNEPHRPGRPPTATAPGTNPMNRTEKILTAIVVGAVLTIATLGFIGSYNAVSHLATLKGFGAFAQAFPIAVDAGIIAFLALDLLLTWRRIAFPLLRYTAWGLTTATIAFNAVAAWPDPVGSSMHGVIPILFVIAVEAARHAIGRIAQIVADKHMEGPNPSRWLLNPVGTFTLWRRQRLWAIRSWDTVLELERERRIYIAQLRKEHGRRGWRRKATAAQILVLSLAKDGMSITEAIELPAREAEKRRQEADRIAREAQQAEDERRRDQEQYLREQQRLEDERLRKLEDDRIEQERKALQLEREREQAERERQVAEAEHQAHLDEIDRQKRAAAEAEQRRQREQQLEHARQVAAEQERAAAAARKAREDEEAAARAATAKEAASRRAAEIVQRAASASAANRSAIANGDAASATANGTTTSASRASDSAASPAATTAPATSASSSQTAANGASTADLAQVVEVYQLLKEQDGKAPSDAKLGTALGVSRSRAQQLRTLAVEAGHADLAKPVRLAS